MKISFLNLYSGAVERGAETQAHQLADQLSQFYQVEFIKGNSSQISTHGFEGNLIQRWLNRKRFFVDSAGLAIFKFSLKHVAHLIKTKPDWVIPMNGFWQLLILKLLQPFTGWKILIVGHSGPGWDERWNLYLKPNVFVASTKPMKDWAEKTCGWTKVILIPYGIDPSRFETSPKSRLPKKLWFLKNLQRPIIVCPSALVTYKQIDLAIKAVAQLSRGSLLVLGKGPLEADLNNLGHKLLGIKRFKITSVDYQLMPQVYQAVDLVTLPSNPQENSPMVFVESLAAGKLVVATDAPRVKWALGNSGFYVDPNKSKKYASQIKLALKQKADTKKDLEKFEWKNVLAKYKKVFENN